MSKNVELSLVESRRFGMRVGRLILDDDDADSDLSTDLDLSDWDVVILRYPSIRSLTYFQLTQIPGIVPIFADCLHYWDYQLSDWREPEQVPSGLTTLEVEAVHLEGLVRSTFSQYPSHYSANPLFDPEAVVDGYIEWVTEMVRRREAICLGLMNPASECVAWAVIVLFL